MLSPKTDLETIAAIEQSFDVNSVTYKDLAIWPLVRLAIYQQLSNPDTNCTRKNAPISNKLPIFSLQRQQLALLHKYKNRDILFYSSISPPAEYIEQIDEKFRTPFTDSMIDFIRDDYSFLKIELTSKKAYETQPRLESTLFIDRPFVSYRADETNSIRCFSDLQRIILEKSGIIIDEVLFIEQARAAKTWEEFFAQILSVLCPRVVFVVCYSHLEAMALISACKKLDIKTVDIQHGTYGDYHGSYTHWTKIPPSGYDMLPDYFWCWGQISKKSIEKCYSPDNCHHQPIVGGNLRIVQWIDKDDPIIDNEMKNFYKQLEKKDKVILLTAAGPQAPLGQHVFEAMHHSPESWLWLIRLHPYHCSKDEKKQMIASLDQNGVSNYEIEYATKCPLYGLLKRCDHHMTAISSTFYEALTFGVPTTIIDPNGLQYYETDINKGILDYADTSEKLLASIRKGYDNSRHTEWSKYIRTDKECAKKALETILSHSTRSLGKETPADFRSQTTNTTQKQL